MRAIAGLAAIILLTACAGGPVGNTNVPAPAKAVDLDRYVGKWYELVRYENSFERDCEGVTAEYAKLPNGNIEVVNTCRQGAVDGPTQVSRGEAKVEDNSGNAKLKVSFFGPFFFGDYWVIDRADDYAWAIVGEPSGRFLWILARNAVPAPEELERLKSRAAALGYDRSIMRQTKQPPGR